MNAPLPQNPMARGVKIAVGASVLLCVTLSQALASGSFICQEPGGKRLVQIDGDEVSFPGGKTQIYIDGNDLLVGNPRATATLVVDDADVRPSVAGVKIAVFDGEDLRHGASSSGKVLINYHHPDLCPTSSANRIYSIEGDALTKQQLVAGLYLLKPELFKLSAEETASQQAAMKEADLESDRLAAADHLAGNWTMLNAHGPVEKVGSGTITVSPKVAGAYPVTFDHTKDGGPMWTGVAVYKEVYGDKLAYIAYGTPKTVALGVYEIKNGVVEGKWYPWYLTDAKSVGIENLKGPENFEGEYTITEAKAPTTGASYAGTVLIKPLEIVGTATEAKPYSLIWTIGEIKVYGIGIRTGNFLYVSAGAGPDINIAKFLIRNGSMTSDWFKLGSTEMGGSAAMNE